MGKPVDFKEATFIEGKLVRISKGKVDIEFEDKQSGEQSLLTLRLTDDVNIDLDTVGEQVKAVIVDRRVARITPLTVKPRDKSLQEKYVASGSPRELGAD